MKSITVGSSLSKPVIIGPEGEMVLVSGPCVIESRELCLEIGEYLKQLCAKIGIGYIFKASFDKANRTSVSSFRGPGLEEGLKILGEIREKLSVPVLSDIHLPDQAAVVAEVLDIIQIPAFLARQTDLVVAAAKTGKAIQVKKAQFMAAADMKNVIDKITAQQNEQIILVERGSSFGYNQLICDMTAIPGMRQLGYPALIDATHSTQKPGGLGNASGGDPEMAPVLARAAMAAGADGIFIEAHPNPKRALSDAASMLRLDQMEELLCCCRDIYLRVRQG
ncbi:MAG: 3-deoxy-8-phosphooctulonate synthase [Sedimentisphaerales bacterium]|nr:3-deoxy-8-phosphooctulonate synthase [Sedimentisphaerales bacterium]